MADSFSKRHGFQQIEKEITIRLEAPAALRAILIDIAYELGFTPKSLRTLVCRVLRKPADKDNWSEYPNMDQEIHRLMDDCAWFQVYDVIENIYFSFPSTPIWVTNKGMAMIFEEEINSYFKTEGIGWQLLKGKIEVRGEESFETSVQTAYSVIEDRGLNTASKEIHEALHDLARRPTPDITGSIQHSMAALECVSREVCGNQKATLGEILKLYSDLVPQPLDKCIEKAWGFSSEMGRHLREGREPAFEDAELQVALSSSICVYLLKKNKLNLKKKSAPDADPWLSES